MSEEPSGRGGLADAREVHEAALVQQTRAARRQTTRLWRDRKEDLGWSWQQDGCS